MKKSHHLSWIVLAAALSVPSAFAKPADLTKFKAAYPNSKALFKCQVCHTQAPQLNPYGTDYEKNNHDLKAIEELESDGDSYKNIDEINASTFPGDKESHPSELEE